VSGLGRNTSEIISSPEWSEIINAVSSSLQVIGYDIRSVLKIGRIFTEKAGLINESLVEMLDSIPIGAVSSIAHLGTSIIAVSDNVEELSESLEKYGKVIIY
jgi:pantoate kinase